MNISQPKPRGEKFDDDDDDDMTTEPNGKVTSAPLSACLGSESAERDFDEVGGTAGGREN